MDNIKEHEESRRERFVRIAEKRVNSIIDQYRKLGNLSNQRNYEYYEEDIKKIITDNYYNKNPFRKAKYYLEKLQKKLTWLDIISYFALLNKILNSKNLYLLSINL